MNLLEDLIKCDEDGKIFYNKWIEWDHFLVPNKPEWLRNIVRNICALFGHCMVCTALDGCYLLDNKRPEQPLHSKCDCQKKDINFFTVKNKVKSECDIRKFTEYVFKGSEASKGKNKIFYDLGFNIKDSYYLQLEYNKQSQEQYINGNYKLKKLDRKGQRLAIPILLNGKSFYSGWMLYPEGRIKNTTPFGGWINEKI